MKEIQSLEFSESTILMIFLFFFAAVVHTTHP